MKITSMEKYLYQTQMQMKPCKERNKTLIDFDCDDSWENVKILMLNIFTRRVREIQLAHM